MFGLQSRKHFPKLKCPSSLSSDSLQTIGAFSEDYQTQLTTRPDPHLSGISVSWEKCEDAPELMRQHRASNLL